MSIEGRKFPAVTAMTIMLVVNVCFGGNNTGFQWWPAVGVSCKINDKWKFEFEQEERLSDDASNMYYEHSDFGFVYSGLGEWIDLGFNYRQVYQKDSAGEYQYENRPHFNVTFKGKLRGWDVSDRSRIEYRNIQNGDDSWRYRNKIAVKFPIELTDLKLQPYVANEAFITFDPDDFAKNRFYTGFTFKLTKNIKTDIYHMWQATKTSSGWDDASVLGTKLIFIF
jgi:hypothetical protein